MPKSAIELWLKCDTYRNWCYYVIWVSNKEFIQNLVCRITNQPEHKGWAPTRMCATYLSRKRLQTKPSKFWSYYIQIPFQQFPAVFRASVAEWLDFSHEIFTPALHINRSDSKTRNYLKWNISSVFPWNLIQFAVTITRLLWLINSPLALWKNFFRQFNLVQ